MSDMRCYVCNQTAPHGTPGWDPKAPAPGWYPESYDLCPKHRRSRPKAMTTLGELVAARKEKR